MEVELREEVHDPHLADDVVFLQGRAREKVEAVREQAGGQLRPNQRVSGSPRRIITGGHRRLGYDSEDTQDEADCETHSRCFSRDFPEAA